MPAHKKQHHHVKLPCIFCTRYRNGGKKHETSGHSYHHSKTSKGVNHLTSVCYECGKKKSNFIGKGILDLLGSIF